MRSAAIVLLVLAAHVSMAEAADKPCVVSWDSIETNLTENHGCNSDPEYQTPCTAFSKCIRAYDICVVSDGEVLMGNSARDISVASKTIVFGINQTFATRNHKYCVMGVMSQAPGEETPSWDYRTFTPNGGWIGETLLDRPEHPHDITTFLEKTASDFRAYLVEVRERLASPSFKDGSYGYRRGEEP